jgi:tetratricopeptide (TPR) repeat protein
LHRGYTDWFVLLWFLLGRINYEFGDYHNAAGQFAFIRSFCTACGVEAPQHTARAWEARSRFAVEGTPEDAETVFAALPEAPETLLFRAEVFSRFGRFQEALPLLEAAYEAEEHADRWPRLGVCWDNGFASIEDLIIANSIGSTELLRIIRSYYAWTLAHLGRQEEAVPIFYALTRGNDGAGIDPYTGLYNYLYSSVLPEERSGDRDDRITILGKSVKLIQERTSRIDEYRDKMRYLRQNTWNQQLMQEARLHNLV